MKNLKSYFESVFLPIALKISQNKYLVAIRDSFSTILPFILTGSFFGIINWVVLDLTGSVMGEIGLNLGKVITGLEGEAYLVSGFVSGLQNAQYLGNQVITGAFSIISLLLIIVLSKKVGEIHGANETLSSLVGLTSFLIMSPSYVPYLDGAGVEHIVSGVLDINIFGSGSVISVLVISFLSVYIFAKLSQSEKLKIKLPDSVPPAISQSFTSLFPVILTLSFFGLFAALLYWFGLPYLNELIYDIVQAPMMNFSQGLGFGILYYFLAQLFWGFGLHGQNIMAPITASIYTPAQLSNQAGATEYILTEGFFSLLSVENIALIIAIFIFSRRKDWKTIAKLSVVPAVFNIGETLMFGLPVVLNPILVIPSMLFGIINTILGYFAMYFGIVPVVKYAIPWTTPGFFNGLISTGSLAGGLLQIVMILLGIAIFAPFIMIANKAADAPIEEKQNV